MNPVIESLKARKSVRVFEDKPIPGQIKDTIIDCALTAPTAGNQTLYTILDITDPDIKLTLSKTCDNQPFMAGAPLMLVFLADCRRWYDCYTYAGCTPRPPCESDLILACADALIAAQNTVVAAESFGIGSCYIGDIVEQYETVRQTLELDDYVFPAALLVYGYPTPQQLERTKPPRFDRDYIVQENRYSRMSCDRHAAMLAERGQELGTYAAGQCQRKYMSDFALEMARSVKLYLRHFTGTL